MKTRILLKLILAVLLLPAGFANSAEPVRVTLAVNGTDVEGDGPDGTVLALGFDHEVVIDRDAAAGTTGRRVHKPIRIVKAIDKSSVLLFKALTMNQAVTATFRFYRLDAKKQPQHYYTVEISGGRVAGVREWKTNTRDLSADRAGDLEEVSFVYNTITWTWVDGGIEHTDTWTSQ